MRLKSTSTKRPEYDPGAEVRRSKRRRRTMSARAEGNRIIVMVPDDLSATAEKQQVSEIVTRAWRRVGNNPDNFDLERRARLLSCTVLEDRSRLESIKWVKSMSRRWASVTGGVDSLGRIRISHRLADVPEYVFDNVIVHELVHTFVDGGHTEEFWYWMVKAPYHERARGCLEAYQRWETQS